jgi:hypothetical protein
MYNSKLDPQFILQDTSAGVMTKFNPKVSPKNSVAHALNFVFDDEYGYAKTRKGSTILGSTLSVGNAVTGIYHYVDSEAGANSKLIATSNGTTYYYDGAAWQTTLSGDTAGLKTRYETFLDNVVRLNGTDHPKSWGGSGAWASSGGQLDMLHFPNGKFVRVFKDQVTVAGVLGSPDSLFISSPPSSGAISWTSNNREIVVNPEDNSNITALGEISNTEIIFKGTAMYRWNNRSLEADVLTEVGCSSQESVCVGGAMMFFFNPKGVWVTNGGEPIRISRRVQKWIDGMSATFYDDVAGYADGEHAYFSIGDCTVDERSFTNIVLRYTLETKEWTVLSYANQFRCFTKYTDSGTEKIVGGTTDSKIFQIESSATSDNGTAINFEIDTHEMDFGSRGIIKEIHEKIMMYGQNPENVLLSVKIDDGDWMFLGANEKIVNQFLLNQFLTGHYFKFRVSGVSSNSQYTLKGIELPNVTLLDYAE